MQKMTVEDLKSLFPKYMGRGKLDRKATKKGAEHVVNPVWLPGRSISPAAFRRQHHKPQRKIVLHPVTRVPKLQAEPIRIKLEVSGKQATQAGYMKRFGSSAA